MCSEIELVKEDFGNYKEKILRICADNIYLAGYVKNQHLNFEIISYEGGINVRVIIKFNDNKYQETVTYFNLDEFPSCGHILISNNVYVQEKWRGKGINQTFLKVREYIAQARGYSTIMCTTNISNVIENHILAKAGWRYIAEIGKGNVLIWTKELEKK